MKKIIFFTISALVIKSYAMEQIKNYCIVSNNTQFKITLKTGNKSKLIKPEETAIFPYVNESSHLLVSEQPENSDSAVKRQFLYDEFPSDIGVLLPGNYVLQGKKAEKVAIKHLDNGHPELDK